VKLQKNTLYGLYAILEIAARPQRAVSSAEIAHRYRISPHHLAKVLRTLGRARLVESARGQGGGYRFSGNAKRLTLMDVIQLFEDVSAPARVLGGAGARTAIERGLGTVLAEIDEIAKSTFASVTLASMLKLLERQRQAG
jgi:Rrf2 family protein